MRQHVSYLRVSTQKQGFSGLGLEAQREAVDAFLRQTSGHLIAEHVEVESGSRRSRPILSEALTQCRRDGAVLVIAKLDRLARNVAFVSSLMESGIEFVAVDAPYANRLMLHVMAAFAEHEREQISQRTRSALAAAKARGVILGANGARLAAKRKSDALIAVQTLWAPLADARKAGATTLQQLADHLNAAGHRTRMGSFWTTGTIHRAVRRLEDDELVSCGPSRSHSTERTTRYDAD